MRPVLADDILMALRALHRVAAPQRAARIGQWLNEAHWADLYRKRFCRAHPRWGNGSLMARAMAEPLGMRTGPGGLDLEALLLVAVALRDWRRRAPSR